MGRQGKILIPAQTGKGKSTLTACLLKQGFQLINDDVVPVNADGSVTALNLPLKIKSGSWDVISPLYPELNHLRPVERQHICLKYLPITADERCQHGSQHTLDWLIVPEYAPEFPPVCRQLAGTEALAALLAAEPHLTQTLTPDYLQQIVRWVTGLKAFSLRYRSSEEALSLLRDMINQNTPSGTQT